jgi:hypothetical protein
MSSLKVIKDRLGAVRFYFWNEFFSQDEDDFYSTLKKYFDIQSRNDLTQKEVDFCEGVIRIMDSADSWSSASIWEMIKTLKKRLDALLGTTTIIN